MHWVLIYWLVTIAGGNEFATGTAMFADQQACINAGNKIANETGFTTKAHFVCVPEGSKP